MEIIGAGFVIVSPRPLTKSSNTIDDTLAFFSSQNLAEKYNDFGVHSNIYLREYPADGQGAYGIGYTGGACSKYRTSHSLKASYDQNDVVAGRVRCF